MSDAPLPSLAAHESDKKFIIQSAPEISFILRGLVSRNALITAQYGGVDEFILTSLLLVDLENRLVHFEPSANAAANRTLVRAGDAIASTNHGGIEIRFPLQRIREDTLQGNPVLCAALPAELLRLQRRENYRITTPIARPLTCTVPVRHGIDSSRVEVMIIDISCGGIGIVCRDPAARLDPGTVHPGCTIAFPDSVTLTVTLEVKSAIDVRLKNGQTCRRYGCRLVRLSAQAEVLMQRYIMQLERHINTRVLGMR